MYLKLTLSILILNSLGFTVLPDYEEEERTIDIGTHSLHAVISGEGGPVVVIDGGIATPGSDYAQIQAKISLVTTVVTYDRAGYGSSTKGPLPRNSSREVDELRKLLKGLGLNGPFIIVGHSLGGLNAEVFAGMYPAEVEGMILLDPPPLDFILGKDFADLAMMASQMTQEWEGIAERGGDSEVEQERREADFFRMIASEHREMFGESARKAGSIGSFGEIPLVVVASGVPNPAFGEVAENYQKFWVAQSKLLASKSLNGRFIFAENSTHMLHRDAEDLVVKSVAEMVTSAQSISHHYPGQKSH